MKSLKTVFTLICTILTVCLICQELVTFTIEKPTTISKERKELETSDLPEVVLCLDPAFDAQKLTRFGYDAGTYFRGSSNKGDLVGWIGNDQGSESSPNKILNDVLLFDEKLRQQLVRAAQYITPQHEFVDPKMSFRTLAYPFGRCLVISPPTEKNVNNTKLDALSLHLAILGTNTTKEREIRLRTFFMDKSTSLQLYPNEMEMLADKLEMRLWLPETKTYKVKISKTHHVQGDPLYECAEYTIDNTYNDCAQNEILEFFKKEIGCQPPLLAKDANLTCNQQFNLSSKQAERIKKFFLQLYIRNVKLHCKTPCSTDEFRTQLVHTTKHEGGTNALVIVFDKKVEIARSTFKIDEQTFLTRLGGSVSSGRTVLWILVSLLGACQVSFEYFTFFLF